YEVKPVDVRETGTGPNRKGYRRADLHGAWIRYLPRDIRDKGDSAGQPRRGDETDAATAATTRQAATGLTSNVAPVADVAATSPDAVTQKSGWGPCAGCGRRIMLASGNDRCPGCRQADADPAGCALCGEPFATGQKRIRLGRRAAHPDCAFFADDCPLCGEPVRADDAAIFDDGYVFHQPCFEGDQP